MSAGNINSRKRAKSDGDLITATQSNKIRKGKTKKKLRRKSVSDLEIIRNPNQKIDPVLDRDINAFINWSPDSAATLISIRAVEGGKPKGGLELQKEANAIVWLNTLFNNKNPRREFQLLSRQDEILQEQQDYLKRHFLAMASFGIQGGNQTKNNYQPLEEFQTPNGTQINLATVASGGGRFNYRSTDGSGQEFNQFLLYDARDPQENPPLQKGTVLNRNYPETYKDTPPTTYLGSYERNSTHKETFDTQTNQIKESSTKLGAPAIGFDIPIGGFGQNLKTFKEEDVTTNYQGRTTDGQYQTGAVLQRYAEQGNLTSTLVAFEGSGPAQDNIYGGSHGASDTVQKVLKIKKSTHTLTGQGKRSTWELTHKGDKDKQNSEKIGGVNENGGLKADINEEKLATLKQQWEVVNNMDNDTQQDFYKRLLLTTTQSQRENLFTRFGLSKNPQPLFPERPQRVPENVQNDPQYADFVSFYNQFEQEEDPTRVKISNQLLGRGYDYPDAVAEANRIIDVIQLAVN